MTSPIETPVARFNYLASEIDCAFHEIALKLGLSDSAMMVLYTLCLAGEECLLGDILRLSGLSKQTVNSALRKLEAEQVLLLRPFQGNRKTVCLTPKGKKLTQDTVLRVIQMENEILDSWTERERDLYLELTRRYLSALREKAETL